MRLCRYSQQSQPFTFLVDSDVQGIYGDASALEGLTILYVIRYSGYACKQQQKTTTTEVAFFLHPWTAVLPKF